MLEMPRGESEKETMADQLQLFDAGPRKRVPRPTCTPYPVGTGPRGETCRTCRWIVRLRGRYLKCLKARVAWTHGGATDIRAKWPACKAWEAREEP